MTTKLVTTVKGKKQKTKTLTLERWGKGAGRRDRGESEEFLQKLLGRQRLELRKRALP